MKKPFEILTQLLPLIEAYEGTETEASVEGFLAYAYLKNVVKNKEEALQNEQLLRNQLGFHLTMLFRFMKLYTKTALKDTPLTTLDDFAFLASIFQEQSIRKTDLIKNHMLEIPSGIEVIKRLVNKNLISEHADEQDKRAVRLMITDFGRTELFKIFGEMNKVGGILAGNLSADELFQLHALLEKLTLYHQKLKGEEG
jgi:MarR family transcriptional regulator, lower aerobic nicotinate degradation pathway regulator